MRKILLAALVVVAVVGAVIFGPILKIKNAKVENANCLGADFLKSTSFYGKSIFLTSADKIKKELAGKYYCTVDSKIQKRYPATISVKAQAVQQALKIDNTNLALDQNGLVIAAQPSDITPTFFPPQGAKLEEGKKSQDQTVLFAATLAFNLQKSDFTASSIRIVEGDSVAVYSRQESVAIFSQKKDIASQVDSLQAILAKAKIDSSKIEKIDLRFDKPILVFKQKS